MDKSYNNESIATAANKAKVLLLCCESIRNGELQTESALQTDRFNLWAHSIGVFASKHRSLDYRLRTAPKVKTTVEGSIEVLAGEIISVFTGGCECTDAELDDFENASDPDVKAFILKLLQKYSPITSRMRRQLLDSVGDAITTLHRLSLSIRRASNRNSLARAARLYDRDQSFNWFADDTRTQPIEVSAREYDTVTLFEEYVRKLLRARWLSTPTTGVYLCPSFAEYRIGLANRCAEAISARRRLLAYFQSHQSKTRQSRSQRPQKAAAGVRIGGNSTTPGEEKNRINVTTHTFSDDFTGSSPGETELSSFHPSRFAQPSPSVGQSTSVASSEGGLHRTDRYFELPPPPIVKSGELEMECPYCCLIMPAKTFDSKKAKDWKKHLWEDLQPYVCLHLRCSTPLRTFQCREDWIRHLEQPHDQTLTCSPGCAFKADNTTSGGGSCQPTFLAASPSQISHLSLQCFVCLKVVESFISLWEHIAGHLRFAFLIALPWRDDIKESDLVPSDKVGATASHSSSTESIEDATSLGHLTGNLFDRAGEGSPEPSNMTSTLKTLNITALGLVNSQDDDRLRSWTFETRKANASEKWRRFASAILFIIRLQSRTNPQPRVRSSMISLLHELRGAQLPAGTSSGTFLPYSALTEIVTKQVVTDILARRKSRSPETISKIASFVCGKPEARRVFAILIYIGQVRLIELFYEHNFVDSILPLYIDASGTVRTWSNQKRNSDITRKVFSDDVWGEEVVLDIFCDAQWQFLAPIFSERQFSYSFLVKHRMPFLKQSGGHRESYFSTVEKWSIHRSHFRTSSKVRLSVDKDGHPIVAVKGLKSINMNDSEYKRAAETEAGVLEMIREMEHPHLIKAIAFYTRADQYSIVFPWAGGGNLRDYWGREPPRKLGGDFVGWVLGQICGLAGAIEKLHSAKDSTYRHGDLKPENILCFEDNKSSDPFAQPFLVITDVGLAKVHTLATEMRNEATRTLNGTVMYEPPEAVLLLTKNLPRSRRYDIWSIGCVYFEFLIWLLYGKAELIRFGEDIAHPVNRTRQFFDVTGSGVTGAAKIKTDVQKWMDWIRRDPRCPPNTAIRKVLELICTRLLVIEVSKPRRDSSGSPSIQGSTTLHATNGPDNPSIIRSDIKISFNGNAASDLRYRATSIEMHQTLAGIIQDASGTEPKIAWMNWQARSPGGPGRYGDTLGVSQSGTGRSPGR